MTRKNIAGSRGRKISQVNIIRKLLKHSGRSDAARVAAEFRRYDSGTPLDRVSFPTRF